MAAKPVPLHLHEVAELGLPIRRKGNRIYAWRAMQQALPNGETKPKFVAYRLGLFTRLWAAVEVASSYGAIDDYLISKGV